jgi:O-antigen ligase
LYKSFRFLNYNDLVTKAIVFASLLVFILFPVSLFEYMVTGIYNDWHPLPWNIRVYNSYLLIVSIFAVWYYITENKYRNTYLAFIFLAFLSILLEGGRSATLAFSVFMILVCSFNRSVRWRLALTYTASWLSYICITYFAHFNLSRLTAITSSTLDLHIVRATSSLRYDLWMNAYQCWLTSPLAGCGFYQLDGYTHLAAHPHNVFIQFLSETGLIGFSFLAFIMITITRNIAWQSKNSYFVVAAFLALGIDLSLSGIHIYPVTQIVLLWLFVFLLKNPVFSHSQYFNRNTSNKPSIEFYLSAITYFILTIIFIFLVIDAAMLTEVVRFGGPRFWEHGYQL